MAGEYTQEQRNERKAQVADRLSKTNGEIFIFVNIGAEPQWSGKRNGVDRYVYPGFAVHGWGTDVSAYSEDELAAMEQEPGHHIIREVL